MIEKLFEKTATKFVVKDQARMFVVFNDIFKRDNRYKRIAVLELEYVFLMSSCLGFYWDIKDEKQRAKKVLDQLDFGEVFRKDEKGLKKFKKHLQEDNLIKRAIKFIIEEEKKVLSYRLLNSVEKAVELQLSVIDNINKNSESLLKTDKGYDISKNTDKILEYADKLPEYLTKISKYHKKLKEDVGNVYLKNNKITGGGEEGPMENPKNSLANKVM